MKYTKIVITLVKQPECVVYNHRKTVCTCLHLPGVVKSYCCYCSKSVKLDHHCFIVVKKRVNVKSWIYVFYDFECTQNTIDTETKRPVHKINYCIAMSICDKCPEGGSCGNCPVDTLSGIGDQNALENFSNWIFYHPVNKEAIFIAHNSSNYQASKYFEKFD